MPQSNKMLLEKKSNYTEWSSQVSGQQISDRYWTVPGISIYHFPRVSAPLNCDFFTPLLLQLQPQYVLTPLLRGQAINYPKDFPSFATVSTGLPLPCPRNMKSLELAKGNFSRLYPDCKSSALHKSWAPTFHNSMGPATTNRQRCRLQLFLRQGFSCHRGSVCVPQSCMEQNINNQCDNTGRWAELSWTRQCP